MPTRAAPSGRRRTSGCAVRRRTSTPCSPPGVDGFVIAAATSAHAPLIAAGRRGRHPDVLREAGRARPGRHPRADRAGREPRRAGARSASSAGSTPATSAAARGGPLRRARLRPPHPGEHERPVPAAAGVHPDLGGFFRDCIVHDFDIIRFVTGREVVSVFATGANRGEAFFGEAGDVDTAAALLTLDDDTFVSRQRAPATTPPATTCGWRCSASRARSRSAWTSTPRCARPKPASPSRRRPVARDLHGPLPAGVRRRADRLHRGRRRRTARSRARSGTPSRRSGSPRRASCPARERPPRALDGMNPFESVNTFDTFDTFDARGDRPMTDLALRIAGAPISWGVCEVPGWGWQLRPRDGARRDARRRHRRHGVRSDGFLPDDPEDKAADPRRPRAARRRRFRPGRPARPVVRPGCPSVATALTAFRRCWRVHRRPRRRDRPRRATTTGRCSTRSSWSTLLAQPRPVRARGRTRGSLATLHPHVGTMVENADETDRVLAGSRIGLSLDTGHLLIGGVDPVARRGRAPGAHRPRTPQGRASRPGPRGPGRP